MKNNILIGFVLTMIITLSVFSQTTSKIKRYDKTTNTLIDETCPVNNGFTNITMYSRTAANYAYAVGKNGMICRRAISHAAGKKEEDNQTQISANIKDIIINSMSVYPNPFSTNTTIGIPTEAFSNGIPTLKVFDIQGRMIRNYEVNQTQFILNREDMKPGIYIIQLSNAGVFNSIGKIMVEE